MKKWSLLSAAILSMNVHANASYCGYKEYFHFSNDTDPKILISTAWSDQDIFLQVIGPRSFVIRDTPRCTTGYAHVTVVDERNNWCVLNIKDGPFMRHPDVSPSCQGMTFASMTYDGFGSYSYTLKFK